MEYRKSYKGLVIWMLAFLALTFAPALLPETDPALLLRLVLLLTMLAVLGLMAIIWRTERVYWINGVTFEQARDAGSARRRAFAMAHLKPFAVVALGYAAFTMVMHLCGVHFWIDIAVFCIALTGAAFSTIKIKL